MRCVAAGPVLNDLRLEACARGGATRTREAAARIGRVNIDSVQRGANSTAMTSVSIKSATRAPSNSSIAHHLLG